MAVASAPNFSAFKIGQFSTLSLVGVGLPGPTASLNLVAGAVGANSDFSITRPRLPALISPFVTNSSIQLCSNSLSPSNALIGVDTKAGAMAHILSSDSKATGALQLDSVFSSLGFLGAPAAVEAISAGVQRATPAKISKRVGNGRASQIAGSGQGSPTERFSSEVKSRREPTADTNDALSINSPSLEQSVRTSAKGQAVAHILGASKESPAARFHFFGEGDSSQGSKRERKIDSKPADVQIVINKNDENAAQIIELSAIMASVVSYAAARADASIDKTLKPVRMGAADLPDAAVETFPGAFDATPAVNKSDSNQEIAGIEKSGASAATVLRVSRADILSAANDNRIVIDGEIGDIPVRRTYLKVIDSKTGREKLVFAGWSERKSPAIALPQGMSIESWMQILGRTAPDLIFSIAGPGGESAQRSSPGDLETGELENRFTASILSQISLGPKSLSDTSILDSFNAFLLGQQRIGEGNGISKYEWESYIKESLRLAMRHTPIFDMDGLRNIIDVQDNAALLLRTNIEMFYEWERYFGTETITEQLFEGESIPALALPDGDIRRELYLALDDALEVRAGMSLDIARDDGVSQAEETGIQWDVAVASLIEDKEVRARAVKAKIAELKYAGKDRLAARMLALIVLHSEVSEGPARMAAREGMEDAETASKGRL